MSEALRAKLAAELAELEGLGCQYAFYYRRRNEAPLLLQNCERFLSASLIKIPILLAWAYLERSQRATRDEICELDLEPEVRGAGLSWLLRARRLPYADVLLLMMALSDNLCANLVIRRIGIERLNNIFKSQLGLRDTVLARKMMDTAARAAGRENLISAQDCVRLFRVRDALAPDERAWIEPLLRAQPDTCLWLRDVPPDSVPIAHKGGVLEGVLHEWAYTDEVDLFLLAQNVIDYGSLYRAYGRLGALALAPT